MSSFPELRDIVATYEDQLEALSRLLAGRVALLADPKSRFHGLSQGDLQARLEQDRDELDRWAVMMLVASFEATVRADMEGRIRARTTDAVRKVLRDLTNQYDGRVRLDDVLDAWDTAVHVAPSVRQAVRRLLKHRHWLAHGRHWTNKQGSLPPPLDVHASLDDYVIALQASVPDFPRG